MTRMLPCRSVAALVHSSIATIAFFEGALQWGMGGWVVSSKLKTFDKVLCAGEVVEKASMLICGGSDKSCNSFIVKI